MSVGEYYNVKTFSSSSSGYVMFKVPHFLSLTAIGEYLSLQAYICISQEQDREVRKGQSLTAQA